VYVEENLRLQHALEEAKAEMDAAATTAREWASGKAGQAAKKTELQGGGQQTDSTGAEGPADQENPPLLPCSRLSGQNRRIVLNLAATSNIGQLYRGFLLE
jgi:hypothetical protein